MPGVPIQFACDVAPRLRRAVETGTNRGDSAAALAELFPEVVTIEISEVLAGRARERFAETSNVTVVQGNSAELLRTVADPDAPTFYFLDAHWSGGETGGEEVDCAIVDELAVLRERGNRGDVLVVDDLRVFEAPPANRDRKLWPTVAELDRLVLAAYPGHRIIHADDQLLAMSRAARRRVFRRALARRARSGVLARRSG